MSDKKFTINLLPHGRQINARAAELCTVKRNIVDPSEFLVTADIQE
jgi:hypothetical protein